ncbi:MAG: hypothetical protein Tsb002_07320 [Wenzhouxiangellaceae bacterium]
MLLRISVILLLTANLGLWAWLEQLPPVPPPPASAQETRLQATVDGIPGIDPVIPQPAENSQCYSFGPLRTPLEQKRAIERIRTFAATVWLRQSEAVVERGWWVYLPSVGDREAALEQAEQIAAAGIDDYFIVTAGDMENTVSLGLYADEDNARQRQQRIKNQGFDAGIGLRREPEPRYWVDYRLDPRRRDLGRILLRAFPIAVRVPIPCPGSG